MAHPPGFYFPSDLARGAAGAASVFLSLNCFVCECGAPATTPKPAVSQRGREVRGALGSRQRRLSIRTCGHGNVAPTLTPAKDQADSTTISYERCGADARL